MKKLIIAAALMASSVSAFAQVTSNSVACGNHYVQVVAVDNVISKMIVDNKEADVARILHFASNGRGSSRVFGINYDGTGYVLTVTPTKFTFSAATFPNPAAGGSDFKVSGPVATCNPVNG